MTHSELVSEVVRDDFSGDADGWVLSDAATYTGSRVRLTPDEVDNEGHMKLRDSLTEKVWRADFRMDVENPNNNGSAEETTFVFYYDDVPTWGWRPTNGYQLSFDHADNEIRLDYFDDGQRRSTTSNDFDIPGSDDHQHHIRVSYDHGTVEVHINSEIAFNHEIETPDYEYDRVGFTAQTGSEASAHYIDDVHILTLTDRNISTAEQAWDNEGIDFHEGSNTHALMEALLSIADRQDRSLYDIKRAHHIDTARGEELDKIGNLVQLKRKRGESDAKYRARLKVQFRVGNIGTTFDEFSEYTAVVLNTDVRNVEFRFNFDAQPATATVAVEPEIYENAALTREEVAEFLGRGVPAGHDVEPLERGTLRLKSDGESDDPSKGLTSDGSEDGGTVAADVV